MISKKKDERREKQSIFGDSAPDIFLKKDHDKEYWKATIENDTINTGDVDNAIKPKSNITIGL